MKIHKSLHVRLLEFLKTQNNKRQKHDPHTKQIHQFIIHAAKHCIRLHRPSREYTWSTLATRILWTWLGRWVSLEGWFCYGKKKEHLTGLFKNAEAWTQATWLKSPFWFKQSLANFSSGLDAVVFIHWLWVGLQLLAGNCLPYHQPNCPTTDKPTKVLEPTWFLLAFRGRRFCLHAFLRKLGTRILLPPALLSKQQDSPQLPQWIVNPFRTTQAHQTRSVLFT